MFIIHTALGIDRACYNYVAEAQAGMGGGLATAHFSLIMEWQSQGAGSGGGKMFHVKQ